jgi:hypothetical protein
MFCDSLHLPGGGGLNYCFIFWNFIVSQLVYQGSMNIIIHFLLPDFKVVMGCLSYCFGSINDKLSVVKCYSTSAVPGFSRNEFNS